MQKVAQFEKVSFEQFKRDWIKTLDTTDEININDESINKAIKYIYDNIKLPKRSTTGSAGYDFFSPSDFEICVNKSIVIPTGIRCKIENGWVLKAYPRSGLGFKHGIHLANTVGIIDSDYYYSDNEGHIFIKLINDSKLATNIYLKQHTAFCQGIFEQFGITYDDEVSEKRNGGFGSTDKR